MARSMVKIYAGRRLGCHWLSNYPISNKISFNEEAEDIASTCTKTDSILRSGKLEPESPPKMRRQRQGSPASTQTAEEGRINDNAEKSAKAEDVVEKAPGIAINFPNTATKANSTTSSSRRSRPQCEDPHCSKNAFRKSLCRDHLRTLLRCEIGGCNKNAVKGQSTCSSHRFSRRCGVHGCRNYAKINGMCGYHSHAMAVCAFEGCSKYAKIQIFCLNHRQLPD